MVRIHAHPPMVGYIYVLKSGLTGKYYVGSSNDPERRLNKQHNLGLVRATKSGIPWRIVFSQKCQSLRAARSVEFRLKKLKSKIVLDKIIRDGYCKLVS